MLDHDERSLALIARVFDGQDEGLTKDDILDNATLYWLTNTAVSSARLYWESKLAFFAPKGVTLPTGVSVFPDEIYAAPRSWAEKAYPNLIHYNRCPRAATSRPGSSRSVLRRGPSDVPVPAMTRPTIVLVHGAFADGSSWNGVIERLQAKGYAVEAPANPLRGVTSTPRTCRAWSRRSRGRCCWWGTRTAVP